MPDSLQPGQHLSPDQLSAFAENVLPEHERLLALTHLSDCPDCRQVVYLTQQASPAPAAAPALNTPHRSWFTLPQVFIAASAALACTLVLALILHFRPAPMPQPVTTAKVEIPPTIAPATLPAALPAAPAPQKPAPVAPSAQLSTAAAHSPAQPRIHAALPAKILPPPAAPQPPAYSLGGSFHGSVTGSNHPVPTSPEGSPAESKMDATPNTGSGAGGMIAYAPPKAPAIAQSAPAPAQLDARKSAMAAQREKGAAQASAADSAVRITGASSISMNGASIDGLPSTARSIQTMPAPPPAPAPSIHLPSNKPVASQITVGSRILALDTAGTLFISYDTGRHWTAVTPQWSGKAVQLSYAPSPARLYQVQPQQSQTQNSSSQTSDSLMHDLGDSAATAAPQQQQTTLPTAGFQLTTASGAVWLSTDGLTWHPR